MLESRAHQNANRFKKNVGNGPQTNKGTRSSMSQLAWQGRSPNVWRENCGLTGLFFVPPHVCSGLLFPHWPHPSPDQGASQ